MNQATPNYSYMPQYQPYQVSNPYLDRLNSLQQYQQALQPTQAIPTLNGRIVDSFDSINANDVPMQGQAVFVKSDGSEVQIRAWGKMGNIEMTSYKPILDAKNENAENLPSESGKSKIGAFNAVTDTFNTAFTELKEQITELSAKFDKLESKFGNQTAKTTSRAKKESDAE